jgi:polyhydroxyalkanoate synthase
MMTVPEPSDDFAMIPRLPNNAGASIASNLSAPQHRPRPLPLFLEMLRSETAGDAFRMKAALKGLRAYQSAPRTLRLPAPFEAGKIGRVRIHGYAEAGKPILFVPSLINGCEILDLSVKNSMMRGLAASGLRPFLLDWGTPGPDEADLDIGGHVERYLLPTLDMLGPDTVLAGYCLGGTMSIAAAALAQPPALLLIAAPWDFSGFSSHTRNDLLQLWEGAASAAEALGLLPAEILQQIFWRIDPVRTIAKFEEFSSKDPESAEGRNYVAVEDWANDGPPMTFSAGRQLMKSLMVENISGQGIWTVAGEKIRPDRLHMPVLNIASTIDRITPEATALRRGERLSLAEGHVGMVVGRKAPGSLWHHIARWVSQLQNS